MATDLTKMVEEWHSSSIKLYRILLTSAAEIEANKKEIDKLKVRHGERIDPKGVKG